MDEFVYAFVFTTVVLFIWGWIDVRRLIKADDDCIYRKVGDKWIKVEGGEL